MNPDPADWDLELFQGEHNRSVPLRTKHFLLRSRILTDKILKGSYLEILRRTDPREKKAQCTFWWDLYNDKDSLSISSPGASETSSVFSEYILSAFSFCRTFSNSDWPSFLLVSQQILMELLQMASGLVFLAGVCRPTHPRNPGPTFLSLPTSHLQRRWFSNLQASTFCGPWKALESQPSSQERQLGELAKLHTSN